MGQELSWHLPIQEDLKRKNVLSETKILIRCYLTASLLFIFRYTYNHKIKRNEIDRRLVTIDCRGVFRMLSNI